MSRIHALPILPPEKTEPLAGRRWWRSLEELADTPEFHEYLHREFPENATEWLAGSRRDFLRLMGASLFLAGVAGCDIKQPQEKIVPTVHSTGHASPGLPLYFTTAYDFAGAAMGLTVQSRDGRPIKIEGNANHPASLGATSVFAQAATLDLYDPDRARTPLYKGQITSLDRLRDELAARQRMLDETAGRGLRLLIGTSTSPTLERLLQAMLTRWPEAKWSVYESVNDDHVRGGLAMAYGEPAANLSPVYDFAQAKVVLSIDCDFLAARDLPPCYVRQFADARRVAGQDNEHPRAADSMVRLYHLGSTPTPTSAKADHALAVAPSSIGHLLLQVARRLGIDITDSEGRNHDETSGKWIANVVDDLRAAGGRSLVLVGREQPASMHAIAHAINDHLGAVGKTVHFIPSPQARPDRSPSDVTMLDELITEMNGGLVDTLVILGGNPIFDAPREMEFGRALAKVEFTLAHVNATNETSAAAKWLVPRSHFLESWADARAFDGTASIVQPLIAPLHDSLSEIELLSILCKDAPTGYAAVRKTWQATLGERDDDSRWQHAVADGVIKNSDEITTRSVSEVTKLDLPRLRVGLRNDASLAPEDSSRESTDNRFAIVFKPDPTIWDGRFINNGWLQELPKPLSHTVWDNAAWIAPADAKRLHLENGDVVSIGEGVAGAGAVDIPIWIMPGQAAGCLTLFTGYGRRVVGRVGQGTGFDVRPLMTKDAATMRMAVPVRKTNRQHQLVTTQHFQTMEGRDIARAGTLSEFLDQPDNPVFAHPPNPAPDNTFYPEWPYEGYKWGMTIDLTACVGCSACVIACQAENNIPVVGKEQVAVNRHMHWMRVDTYYTGSPEQPEQTLNQPVTCMHCERAPCEVVCPVAATNHSDEGINQMVYNRCVGTRYCSNNCPYKVRRFNFLDYSDDFISDPTLHLLSNPEVTMRQRGVMEKCTYCIQRIEGARIASQLEDRSIRDGEIKTACQAVCPAQAIRFGDLNDANSRVRQTHDHPLTYALLEELNTRPRTTYLAEVTNPKE
ncbi:MAG: TAT-variant-translocated molybdopterin oxidoreductase [Planctomycetota bacterium]